MKKNHRVYALYHDDDVSCNFDWLLLDDTIWNKWTNTQTPNELTNKLTEFSNDFYTEEHFVKTLFCLQACMTPNNQMIKKYIMKKYFGKLLPKKYKNTPMSLKDVAKEGGYIYIFEKGTLHFANENNDVLPLVKKKLKL